MTNNDKVFHSDNSSDTKREDQVAPKIRGVEIYDLTSLNDSRGSLTVGQFPTSLPFKAKRFFFISEVPIGSIRGEHAHFECEQFLVAIKGSVKVLLEASGEREEYALNSSEIGLLIPPMTWGVQYEYSEDCVLLVLASHEFDRADYITNHDTFVSLQSSP